jgi:ADP-dependent NAD(P)H-hydrate dehydratase / NAD(P)H-hydrate epimerase
MSTLPPAVNPAADGQAEVLPADDPVLQKPGLDLPTLSARWARNAGLRPMTAEQMRGADVRARRFGVPSIDLMEQAGAAVAAAARATLASAERPAGSIVLVLAGPGNNGGDGCVAARYLAAAGVRSVVVLVSRADDPDTPDAAANWQRLEDVDGVERMHAETARDLSVLANGIERAGLVVDALLGTGARGELRSPIRDAVDLTQRARAAGVPVLAVDTPTSVDLTSGQPSDPVVRADVTITFHRPKEGLRIAPGKLLAGHVLVAPIGIPAAADPT